MKRLPQADLAKGIAGFHTKGEAVARCDNELPLSSF